MGLIETDLDFDPNPAEVRRRFWRSASPSWGPGSRCGASCGEVPIRTPTYVVADHLIWGATARILGELIGRLPGTD